MMRILLFSMLFSFISVTASHAETRLSHPFSKTILLHQQIVQEDFEIYSQGDTTNPSSERMDNEILNENTEDYFPQFSQTEHEYVYEKPESIKVSQNFSSENDEALPASLAGFHSEPLETNDAEEKIESSPEISADEKDSTVPNFIAAPKALSNLKNKEGHSQNSSTLKDEPIANTSQFMLTKSVIAILFLTILGVIAVIMTKLKRKDLFSRRDREEKKMEITSQLLLSPKRKIITVRINDEELVLANTESGIQLLTTLKSKSHTPSTDYAPSSSRLKASSTLSRLISENKQSKHDDPDDASFLKEPELPSRANPRANARTNSQAHTSIEAKETSRIEEKPATQGHFPKYLAQAFEQESRKDLKKNNEEESIANVTNMIREKLKSMKPLA